MSQEKTSVPGMENSYYANKKSNMYSRTTTPDMGSRGTMVPGMEEVAPNVGRHESSAKGGAPVVGFLYSISRQGIGEYWPLHIGSNKIGRSGNCDICLKEGTVSDIHAELNIKQMKTTHKILASIKDIGSKNGIFVNEEELDYSAHECFNNDLITIGLNYRLLLILIDTQALGLTVSENFIPIEEEEDVDFPFASPKGTGGSFNPYDHNNRPMNNGTVAMDGVQGTEPGGTKFM